MRAVDHQPGRLAQHLDPCRPAKPREAPDDGVAARPRARARARPGRPAPPARPPRSAPGGVRAGAAPARPSGSATSRPRRRHGVGRLKGGRGGIASNRKSIPSSRSGHRRRAATRRIACLGSSSQTPLTAGRDRLRIPAFSVAIAPSVLPSCRVWSKAMLVMTERTGWTTLVESSRPPMPTSSTTASDLAPGEVEQAHGRGDLEEGRAAVAEIRCVGVELFHRGADLVDQRVELGRGDRPAVDAVPFLQPMQVRRAVESRAGTRRGQGRGHHGGRRALPLGPGDVDHAEPEVGIAQPPEEPAHPSEAELGRGPGHAHRFVIQAAVEVVEAVLVIVEHGDCVGLDSSGGDRRTREPFGIGVEIAPPRGR